MIAPTPGTACKRAATILRKRGIVETSLNTRKTRNALNTDNVSLAGINVIPTTTKSKILQGSRKNWDPFAKIRNPISIQKIIIMT